LAGFGVAESGDALPLDAEEVISGELLLDVVLAQNGRKIGLGCCLGFFFFLSAGCCLRGVFLGDQLIDSIFEVDGAGVAAEVDLSPLVDKAHEGNAADGKILD
jgi:hypothetical protein